MWYCPNTALLKKFACLQPRDQNPSYHNQGNYPCNRQTSNNPFKGHILDAATNYDATNYRVLFGFRRFVGIHTVSLPGPSNLVAEQPILLPGKGSWCGHIRIRSMER